MAGIEGRVQMRREFLAWTAKAKKTINNDTVESALTAAIIAKNTGQNRIATVPSDLSIEPKVGRIWTGAMYQDFDADVTQRGTKITIKIGWINRKRKYYDIQEYGGVVKTKRGPINVTGMHAITDATMAAQRYLDDKGINL